MLPLAHRPLLGLALAAAAALCTPAPAAAQASKLRDTRLGFELGVPGGWTPLPVKLDEPWIVAKYMSDRIFSYTNAENGRTYEEHAELLVAEQAALSCHGAVFDAAGGQHSARQSPGCAGSGHFGGHRSRHDNE